MNVLIHFGKVKLIAPLEQGSACNHRQREGWLEEINTSIPARIALLLAWHSAHLENTVLALLVPRHVYGFHSLPQ